jgi:hypothetical protein
VASQQELEQRVRDLEREVLELTTEGCLCIVWETAYEEDFFAYSFSDIQAWLPDDTIVETRYSDYGIALHYEHALENQMPFNEEVYTETGLKLYGPVILVDAGEYESIRDTRR